MLSYTSKLIQEKSLKFFKSFKSKNNNCIALEELERHDAIMLVRFNNVFHEINETSKVFKMGRKEEKPRKQTDENGLNENITPNPDISKSSVIQDIIIYYMNDKVFESFVIFTIGKMLEYDFNQQASVNIFNKNDGRPIEVKNEKLTSYEIFAQVNLSEHTHNVIIEFKKFMDNKDFILSEEDARILVLSCLFHDFGKCIKMAKSYNLYAEGMTSKKYKHENISSQLIEQFALSCPYSTLLLVGDRRTQIEKLKLIVSQHHAVSFTVRDPLVKYLKQIDAAARSIEYENLAS